MSATYLVRTGAEADKREGRATHIQRYMGDCSHMQDSRAGWCQGGHTPTSRSRIHEQDTNGAAIREAWALLCCVCHRRSLPLPTAPPGTGHHPGITAPCCRWRHHRCWKPHLAASAPRLPRSGWAASWQPAAGSPCGLRGRFVGGWDGRAERRRVRLGWRRPAHAQPNTPPLSMCLQQTGKPRVPPATALQTALPLQLQPAGTTRHCLFASKSAPESKYE